jgi:thiamine-phosphate pyrophosphorylase
LKNPFTKNRALYLITDRTISGLSHVEMTRQAISTGIKIIQLREKLMSKREFYKEALSVRTLSVRHRMILIINDYVDIAMAVDADGVHLGQEDMPLEEARRIFGKNKIIGVSTHTLKQAIDAERRGADYIGFGPIFKTTTKDAGHPKGINSLIEVKRHIKIPVVAIGGINLENVSDVLRVRVDAVAVASAILSGDMKTNIKRFLTTMKNIKGYR